MTDEPPVDGAEAQPLFLTEALGEALESLDDLADTVREHGRAYVR